VSGQLASTDINRQLSAQQQLGALTQASQALNAQDRAALEASGSAYQSQQQREIDAARQQFAEEQAYPRQTLDWLSTQIRGMAPITPQTTTQTGTANTGLSPLSQLAAAGAAAAGLYKQFGT
jgi:Lon protease-like protein